MTSPVLGEFLGTMVLVLLGNGVVAGVVLKRSKAEASGWMVITAGWAFAVMAGVFTAIACGSSDAHLNPAVTLGFAVRAGDFGKVAPYIAAQMLGAVAGAALVWLHYLPHWKETPDAPGKLACFCTAPAIRSLVPNLISEIIGTFVLVFVVGAIFSKSVAAGGLGVWGLTWWGHWFGGLGFRSAARPVMRLIRRETWVRAWRMRFSRWRGRVDRIGAMRRFRWLGRWWAALWRDGYCGPSCFMKTPPRSQKSDCHKSLSVCTQGR